MFSRKKNTEKNIFINIEPEQSIESSSKWDCFFESPYNIQFQPLQEVKSDNTIQISTIIEYRKKVESCWKDCVAKNKQTSQNLQNIIGQSFSWEIEFDSSQLLKHHKEIVELLRYVSKATSFEDLAILDSGEKWTTSHFYLNMLLTMANALNLIEINRKDENQQLIRQK